MPTAASDCKAENGKINLASNPPVPVCCAACIDEGRFSKMAGVLKKRVGFVFPVFFFWGGRGNGCVIEMDQTIELGLF